MTNQEQMAIELGNNKKELKKRIETARQCLTGMWKLRFGKGKFEFENKRMVSDNGLLALQWAVRTHPNSPIDPNNQQTTVGCVYLVEL
jgi:hypothetical protein